MAKKKNLRFRAVGMAILFLALTMACLVPGIPTGVPPSPATMTGVMVTDTSAPPTVTRTPRPTATATPPPEWVTNFAQPILDAIANRPPDFQDDFHDKSGGWHLGDFGNYCGDWRMQYVDGELVVTVGRNPAATVGIGACSLHRHGIGYTDFAMEVDGRFLPGTPTNSSWSINFRFTVGEEVAGFDFSAGHVFTVSYEQGGLGAYIRISNSPEQGFPVNRPASQFTHLLLIAKGSKFAFYVNGQPLYYIESAYCQYGDIFLTVSNNTGGLYGNFQTDTNVAFDNFKIWNISNLP